MVKYDKVIQGHTMSKDEFKIQKDEDDFEKELANELYDTMQAIFKMIEEDKPSIEYRRIGTITAANSTLYHIWDEVRTLAQYDLGKHNDKLIEITNRLNEDIRVCNTIIGEAEADIRKECDPWKYGMKEE